MNQSHSRTIIAGVAGGLAMNIAMLLTFRVLGFGVHGEGILLNPSLQSRKLIAKQIFTAASISLPRLRT